MLFDRYVSDNIKCRFYHKFLTKLIAIEISLTNNCLIMQRDNNASVRLHRYKTAAALTQCNNSN